MIVNRFEVYLVNLDPTEGSEIKKTRPCLIISPNEMNRYISTVIVAPMTTKGKNYPTRINCKFQGKEGQIDRITERKVLRLLQELFSR